MDKIKIEGLKELSDAMGQLPGAIAKRVLAGAVRKAALIVQARAIALAPEAVADTVTGKSTHVRGTLKRSISISAIRKGTPATERKFAIYAASARRKGSKVGASDPNDGWYAHFVEFGTVKMGKTPFMRPAFEETKIAAKDKIVEQLQNGIKTQIERLNTRRGR
jgi:HK97 gp10 family phage protein